MCGIFGLVGPRGTRSVIDDAEARRLRDSLSRRGPDGAGLWREENVLLAHRRLAVLDPGEAGAQPMFDTTGRYVLVYNGELYNDAELRSHLEQRGHRFRTSCDTETLLAAFVEWGPAACERLRGMFAYAVYDRLERVLYLARDPLGIKPLYFTVLDDALGFASEPEPLLALPGASSRPNLSMVSAYLSTLRVTLGNHTLYDRVFALAPGERGRIDLERAELSVDLEEYWRGAPVAQGLFTERTEAAEYVREVVSDSVARHLRADVPTCVLLSGGLDSTIVGSLAKQHVDPLRTYCAGAPVDSGDLGDTGDGTGPATDLDVARRVARELGTNHAEAHVTREAFAADWQRMVETLGAPLSTPNEVAIRMVSERLAADGCVVTIGGEGADELFGGYGPQLAGLIERVATGSSPGGPHLYEANAWVRPSLKQQLLLPDLWQVLDFDGFAYGWYEAEFQRCVAEVGDEGGLLDAHLRFLRRTNLTGLLRRLDTATMLASVEGRTPFADVAVVELAESLPFELKVACAPVAAGARSRATAAATVGRMEATSTKRVLRDAFDGRLPVEALRRPKASFPLPFNTWIGDQAERLRDSPFAASLFKPHMLDALANDLEGRWNLAWPIVNLALWGDRHWG